MGWTALASTAAERVWKYLPWETQEASASSLIRKGQSSGNIATRQRSLKDLIIRKFLKNPHQLWSARRKSPHKRSARHKRPRQHCQISRRKSPHKRSIEAPAWIIFDNKGCARLLFNDQGHVRARFNSLGSAICFCTDSRCAIVSTYSWAERYWFEQWSQWWAAMRNPTKLRHTEQLATVRAE